MTLTCRSFSATPLPTGEIQLEIAEATPDASQEKLSLTQVASLLNKSVKAVDKLSRRKKDPLPVYRGKGRPFSFRYEVNNWLRTPAAAPPRRRSVFGSPT